MRDGDFRYLWDWLALLCLQGLLWHLEGVECYHGAHLRPQSGDFFRR